MDLSLLPSLNAGLNACAGSLLVIGRWLIRRGHLDAHRRVMLGAFAFSTLFLVSYLVHKASRAFESTTLHAEGGVKALYLVILATHVVGATLVPFLAIALIRLGLSGRIASHRALAQYAWWIWIYVSATGILIYFWLYHWNPPL